MKLISKQILGLWSASKVSKHIQKNRERNESFLANLLCSEYSYIYERERVANTCYSNVWRRWIISKFDENTGAFVAYLGKLVPTRYQDNINSKNFVKAVISVSKKTIEYLKVLPLKLLKKKPIKKLKLSQLNLKKHLFKSYKNKAK